MSEKLIKKIGYYSITENKTVDTVKYVIDSGQTVFLKNYGKYIINKNREIKDFKTLEKAEDYINKKLKVKRAKKTKKIASLPKSLYLILIKEEVSKKTFVKVGITSKRFIVRRFSKEYGYDGYVVESILRRIDTPDAAKLEAEIKDKLKKKFNVKKYRPLLESFSGYSECFDITSLEDIIKIFDDCTNES